MYLLDTNVISELRKKGRKNLGVVEFFRQAKKDKSDLFISVITIGELRRGVENIRHRRDEKQAMLLESWLGKLLSEYSQNILPFGTDESHLWGKLRVPCHENALDKQIAATAIIYDLTVVTRNIDDFEVTGVKVLNPFDSY